MSRMSQYFYDLNAGSEVEQEETLNPEYQAAFDAIFGMPDALNKLTIRAKRDDTQLPF